LLGSGKITLPWQEIDHQLVDSSARKLALRKSDALFLEAANIDTP
jgi:hypothetical protein